MLGVDEKRDGGVGQKRPLESKPLGVEEAEREGVMEAEALGASGVRVTAAPVALP